jgi:ribosomal protein S27AE
MNDKSESSQDLPTASPVTLYLPSDVVSAIAQLAQQSGKDQTQLLIEALRQGLGLISGSDSPALTLAQIVDRLTVLESLPQRVKRLEAKVNHLATPKEPARSQIAVPAPAPAPAPSAESTSPVVASDRPPSPPSQPFPSAVVLEETDAPPEQCPKCEQKLGAPLKATGRQVCAKCGWTNKPRSGNSTGNSTKEPPVDDLKQLLDQAAVDALTNMKPKGKQNPGKEPGTGGIRFPLFGK